MSESRSAALPSSVDVLFISMPFGPLQYPSIGLSILSQLLPEGCTTATRYFTFDWAERIGFDLYSWIEESNPVMLAGEWVFSEQLFGRSPTSDEAFTNYVLRTCAGGPNEEQIQALINSRQLVPQFIEDCVREVAAIAPRVIGFTSIFQQNVAALALAQRIREELPEIKIIFGGANCEGVMGLELARQFPFLDAVCSGEGEAAIAPLIAGLLAGSSIDNIPAIFTQRNCQRPSNMLQLNGTPLEDMNRLKPLDYRGFFEQWQRSTLANSFMPSVLFETSRGCWWGQKNHCTFCGLNGGSMKYRSKSSSKALAELTSLVQQFPQSPVIVVDNILDMSYFDEFLPDLIKADLGVHLFYEVKSNLKKAQLTMLRDAGVLTLQPGIESLSTPVLKIMKKGVSGILNIQMLKWCKQLGITPLWNLLVGFPGEPESEYARMAELAPRLAHLPPPHHCAQIRLDRFSPNFDHSEKFGFINVQAIPAYRYVYALPHAALQNIAYHFSFDYADGRDVPAYVARLRSVAHTWRENYQGAELVSMVRGEEMVVWDFREIGGKVIHSFTGIAKFVLENADAITNSHQLYELAEQQGAPYAAAQIEAQIAELDAQGFLYCEGAAILSLLLQLEEYVPSAATVDKLMDVLQAQA